jgi:hypothetical protein
VSPRDELRAAVAARVEGTPYVLVDTAEGFDLRIDLADARWYGLLGTAGRKKVVQHRVRVDEDARTYALVDDHYDLRWDAGAGPAGASVPRLGAQAEASRTRGRVREVSFEKTFGVDATTKRPDVVVDYVFRSDEGQRLVREPAEALGWKERQGWEVRVATVAAVVGGAGALATVGWALWAWQTGALG